MEEANLDYDTLFKLCIDQYPNTPREALRHIIKDFIAHPDYYDDLRTGKIQPPVAKHRDTQDDINLLNNSNIDDNCSIDTNLISEQ